MKVALLHLLHFEHFTNPYNRKDKMYLITLTTGTIEFIDNKLELFKYLESHIIEVESIDTVEYTELGSTNEFKCLVETDGDEHIVFYDNDDQILNYLMDNAFDITRFERL